MLVNLEHEEFHGEDEDFAKMLEASEKRDVAGALQMGEIIAIDDEYAMVAVAGEKLEAKLRLTEIQDENGNTLFKVNDKIEAEYAILE